MTRPWHLQKKGGKVRLQIDAKRMRKFLSILADGWTSVKASIETGISHSHWQRERKNNPSFAKRWLEAEKAGVATLEDAAHKRGVRGVLRPVVSQGRIVTFVREYSDGLLSNSLKARSEKYAPAAPGDRAFEESFVVAAETLYAKLDSLFERLEVEDSTGGVEVSPNIKR